MQNETRTLSKTTKATFYYVPREVKDEVDELATLDAKVDDLLIVNGLVA